VATAAGGLPRIGRGLCGVLGHAAPYLGVPALFVVALASRFGGHIVHSPYQLFAISPPVRSEPARKGRSRGGEVNAATKSSFMADRAILHVAARDAVRVGNPTLPFAVQRGSEMAEPKAKKTEKPSPFSRFAHARIAIGHCSSRVRETPFCTAKTAPYARIRAATVLPETEIGEHP